MLFSKSIAATAALVSSVSAAALTKRGETWTLDGVARGCKPDDSQCTWAFNINNHKDDPVYCRIVIEAQNGQGASKSHGGPVYCGDYRLESSYDSSMGADKGFTVIGVLDQARQLIAFFGYDDHETANGRTVKPDHKGDATPFHQKN